jgi:hypothetical protein
VGQALEVIPRTLAQNCGTNVIRALTKLRAKHSEKGGSTFGIDGNKGALWHSFHQHFSLPTHHSKKTGEEVSPPSHFRLRSFHAQALPSRGKDCASAVQSGAGDILAPALLTLQVMVANES